MIPWEELGFEIVYTTTDSISALEKIALLKPDAVITTSVYILGMVWNY